jgi:Ribonuclease G/E
VFQEPDLIERTVRDFLTEDVERIVVDSPKAYDRMREMISKISEPAARKVKLYNESQAIFDRFNISKQLDNAFSRTVHLKSGGYIVVDETEALVAIDVNTGRHKGGKDQETAIGRVKSALTMSVEIQRKLGEILKKRPRDESDFQLRIVVHPSVLDRLRNEDEKHLIEMEKRYFGKLSFRADPALHAELFKIVNVTNNEELA